MEEPVGDNILICNAMRIAKNDIHNFILTSFPRGRVVLLLVLLSWSPGSILTTEPAAEIWSRTDWSVGACKLSGYHALGGIPIRI